MNEKRFAILNYFDAIRNAITLADAALQSTTERENREEMMALDQVGQHLTRARDAMQAQAEVAEAVETLQRQVADILVANMARSDRLAALETENRRLARVAETVESLLRKLGALTAENVEQFQRLATLERRYEALGRSVAESGLVIAERLNALEKGLSEQEAAWKKLQTRAANLERELGRSIADTPGYPAIHSVVSLNTATGARVAALELQVKMDREKLADLSTRLVAIERMAPEPGEQTDRRW